MLCYLHEYLLYIHTSGWLNCVLLYCTLNYLSKQRCLLKLKDLLIVADKNSHLIIFDQMYYFCFVSYIPERPEMQNAVLLWVKMWSFKRQFILMVKKTYLETTKKIHKEHAYFIYFKLIKWLLNKSIFLWCNSVQFVKKIW